jgi:hypothetical protein
MPISAAPPEKYRSAAIPAADGQAVKSAYLCAHRAGFADDHASTDVEA